MKFKNDSILLAVDAFLDVKMRIIKGKKVLLDYELAELLEVSTNYLIKKVRANKDRFPNDFLIKLPAKNFSIPKRKIIYAFTLGGVMMAAGRFKTERANRITIKVVERVCDKMGGMEEILKLLQKSQYDL